MRSSKEMLLTLSGSYKGLKALTVTMTPTACRVDSWAGVRPFITWSDTGKRSKLLAPLMLPSKNDSSVSLQMLQKTAWKLVSVSKLLAPRDNQSVVFEYLYLFVVQLYLFFKWDEVFLIWSCYLVNLVPYILCFQHDL